MGFIPNKENILTYLRIIQEASPKSEIFKYISRRIMGKRVDFDQDVFIKNNGSTINCGRLMNNCSVACSQFEKDLSPEFKNMSIVLDIGANIGKHSIEMAKTCDKVIAIEPDKDSYKLLKQNIELNNIEDKVTIINKACGEKQGTVSFFRDAVYPTSNSITVKKNAQMTEEKVECDTVDNICNGIVIDFIKVDVEGGELDTLKGAKKTIDICKPKIIFEAWNKEAADEIKSYLKHWGYSFTNLDTYNYLAEVKKSEGDK